MRKKNKIPRDGYPLADSASHVVVTKQFRETLLDCLPGLRKRQAYRRLAGVLLFSTFADEYSGDVIVPWQTLAKIEDKTEACRQRKYNGTRFLERFRDDVMLPGTMKWTAARYINGLARTVCVCWPPAILEALAKEYRPESRECSRVYLCNGRPFNEAKRRAEMRRRWRAARPQVQNWNPAALPVLRYLDDRSTTIYTQLVNRNMAAAREAIEQIVDPKPKRQTRIRRRQHNILTEIQTYPKPIYRPSRFGCTDRIFTVNSSYLGLKHCVRKALLKGWYDCDLRYAHLAIAATTWQIPEVTEFLESGQSIWRSLIQHIGVDPELEQSCIDEYEEVRKAMKTALYSCLYGMSDRGIRYGLIRNPLLRRRAPEAARSFFHHPVISVLLDCRKSIMDGIRRQGYGDTCFDRRIQVEKITEEEDNVASIMAQQAQAVELQLLLPVIEFATQSNDEVTIMLWFHDGFVAHFPDHSRRDLWEPRLKDTVRCRARELNIVTELECTPL